MKYLVKYNESNNDNHEYDIHFIISKIGEEFSTTRVKKMFDDEVYNWSDGDFDLPPEEIGEEDFDGSAATWYKNNGNGEAEEIVLYQMIDWFESKYSGLTAGTYKSVYSKLQDIYKFLKH